jgi:hypothetical protein
MKTRFFLILILISFLQFSCRKKTDNIGNVIDSDITENTTWTKDKVWIIQNTVEIKNNAVLTIEAGTTVKFDKNAELDVGSDSYGTLIAKGTSSEPIVFTSNSDVPNKGDYYGIWLYNGANNCDFEYCTFEYGGGYSNTSGIVNVSETNASFKNCTFQHSAAYGILLYKGGFASFSSNIFNDNAVNPISIYADHIEDMGTGNVFDGGNIDVCAENLTKSGTVEWKNQGIPYVIDGDVYVASASGTILKIDAGCQIKFKLNAELAIGDNTNHGQILAQGSSSQPIIFTTAAVSPTKGDWYGISFYDGAMNGSKLEYCTISYAGGYDTKYSGDITVYGNVGSTLSISNCTISNSAGWGIYVDHNFSTADPSVSNISFSNNTSGNKNF